MSWSKIFRGMNVTQDAGDLVKEARMKGGRSKTRRCASRHRKSRRRYR